jgi:hypothetical protein
MRSGDSAGHSADASPFIGAMLSADDTVKMT